MRRLFPLVLAFILLFVGVPPISARDTISVYYAGPEGGARTALSLAENFEIVADPSQADVFLLNGVIPDPERVAARVRAGAGLVLILGPALTAPEVEALWGAAATLERRYDPVSLTSVPGVSDPVVTEIIWNSAPQIRERFQLGGGGLEPLAEGFEDGALILGAANVGSGRVFVFMPFLDDANPQFQEWAYFNYFIYHLTAQAGGRTPLSFDICASAFAEARSLTEERVKL